MSDTKEQVEIICFIFLIVIIVFGTIGNIVSLVIWSHGTNSKSLVCSSYFKLVSISDICVLLLPGIYEVLRLYPVRYGITEYSNFLCKTVTFGRIFTTQISTWLVVAITVERSASILFPLKYHLDKARKRAYIAGCVICVVSLLSNSLFFYAMELPIYNTSYLNNFYNKQAISASRNTTGNVAINNTGSRFPNVTESHTVNRNNSEFQSEAEFDEFQSEAEFGQSSGNVSGQFAGARHDKVAVVGYQNGTGFNHYKETETYFMNSSSFNLTNESVSIDRRYCDFVNLPRIVERTAWTANYVVLICFMPLSIILLCNIAILVRLCTTHKLRNSAIKRRNSLEVFTRLVLAIGVVFTLSTLPMALYVLKYLKIVSVTFDMLPTIARSLFCLNNGSNFILYFISGKKFRKDFKTLFKSVFKCCRQTRKLNSETI